MSRRPPSQSLDERVAIGLALKQARILTGRSQAEAAETAGTTQQTWSKVEKGAQAIDIVALHAYARAVGLDREGLLFEASKLRGDPARHKPVEPAPPAPEARPLTIPVWGLARGGPQGAHVYEFAEPDNYLDVTHLYRSTAKAMQLVGDSVYPWAMSGTTIIYDTSLWPRKDEGCVIETLDGQFYVKLFERVDDDKLYVRELMPVPRTIEFDRSMLRGVYCVTDRIDRAR